MTIPRAVRCREWMQERYITFPALAKQLGMKSEAGPRMLIARETIPVERLAFLKTSFLFRSIFPVGLVRRSHVFPV